MKSVLRAFRIPTELSEAIDKMAEEETRTVTNMVLVLLKEAIKARKNSN
ncbi:ribbon-helix-helix domain-containing protein [Enterovibrio calviensis]|nr:hypothetical protein [Enterovibrio calviensis]